MVAVSAIVALNVDAATVTVSVATLLSATLALNVEALTVAASNPVVVSAIAAENVEAATETESAAVLDSEMFVANPARARNVSITDAASATEELNVFDPEAAKGAAAKAEPLNICYPIRQRQG